MTTKHLSNLSYNEPLKKINLSDFNRLKGRWLG